MIVAKKFAASSQRYWCILVYAIVIDNKMFFFFEHMNK